MGDADPTELVQIGELLAVMGWKLKERNLDAEMDEHLSRSAAQDAGNVRNGHDGTSVLIDSRSMLNVGSAPKTNAPEIINSREPTDENNTGSQNALQFSISS